MFGSLAAMILVGWTAFRFGNFRLGKPTSGVGGAPAVVVPTPSTPFADNRLAPDEVARKIRAFGEVDQAFDGQTNWLLLSSESSEVGLANRPSRAVSMTVGRAGPKILLVRLSLLRGTDVVSNADLLIVAGTTANVIVPTTLGVPLQYHVVTSARDPMHLSVRVEIPRDGVANGSGGADGGAGAALAVLGTSLQLQPYRDSSAGTLVLERGAFDLQITAAPSDRPG